MDAVNRRFFIGALICWIMAAIVIALAATGVTQSLDNAGMLELRAIANPLPEGVTDVMRGASWLGDGWPRSLIAIAFIGYLIWRKFYRAVSYILYTGLGIAAINEWGLKAFFMRPRPDIVPWLTEVTTPSFSLPSGHAANSAAVYGAMAIIAAVLWWRKAQRRALWAATFILVVMIGLSRIWLGVHWPSDVVAGWLVGVAWALTLAVLLKPVKARNTL